jgi:hypothetical protein
MKSTKPLPDESNSEQPKNFSPNCEVQTSDKFERNAKRLYKKYASLANEIRELTRDTENGVKMPFFIVCFVQSTVPFHELVVFLFIHR